MEIRERKLEDGLSVNDEVDAPVHVPATHHSARAAHPALPPSALDDDVNAGAAVHRDEEGVPAVVAVARESATP